MPAGILAAALIALLAFAPLAAASPDPVGSGSTKITLNKGWTKYLGTFGIKIRKISPAKVKGKQVTMPVTGGSLDPLTGLGEVTLGGGIKFKAGKKTAPVKALVLNTNKRALFAKVVKKRVKFANVAGWSFTRNGFGVTVTVKKLKLTNAAASRLNKKLGYAKGKPKPFLKNKVIGKSTTEAQPSTVAVIPSGEARLALSPAAIEKLAKVGPEVEVGPGVKVNPFAVKAATVAPTSGTLPDVGFPISGGTMAPTATSGVVQTIGGLTLTQDLEAAGPNDKGQTTLTMGNIWIDMGTKQASVEVTITNPKTAEANLGNLGRASIADFVVGPVTIDATARTISVANASATLQAVTAETLNSVFIKPIEAVTGQPDDVQFAAGDPLGTFSFTVQTQ